MTLDSSPTARLAAFASELDYDAIPAAALEQARRSILDTFGCALQGSTLPWGRMLHDLAVAEGGEPEAAVWGTGLRVSGTRAALLNGTAGHSFELDDVHMGGMIHPGSLTLPSALAIGERAGLDGKSLLTSVVVGCEVGARVGLAVGTGHFRAGFHPQGTVGVFAAAASAARAAALDAGRVRNALGIAGSQAAGLMAAQEGAMVKRMHSGRACESGVLAVLLAQRGFTGIPDVLEADFGGFVGSLGGGCSNLELLTDGLGERWEIEQVGFKAYASCAAAHTSLDVTSALRSQHGISPGDVRSVTVQASTHATVHCGWPYHPTGVTAAQMNIPYGVARMLIDGSVSAEHFTESAIADERVLDLAAKVSVLPDHAIDELGPARRYTVRVEIKANDGRVFAGAASDRTGSPSLPLSQAQLEAKFVQLAVPVIGIAQAEQLAALVARLDDVADVRDVTALLAQR